MAKQKTFDLAICLALILSTLAVYSQTTGFDFVNYDDDSYVFENAHVQAGLTPDSIKWAFTATVAGNWMPVTLLSHMVDAQLFGMQSGMHHLDSVVLHTLSALLLFLLLRRATGAPGVSAFVAFGFALHPLHVESVAWVAERKDVLSTLFWFLALYAYVRYTEQPSSKRYLLIAVPFCLGLMSKPMLVTFPFTLVLLDLWPLRRFQWPKTIWEKFPLFALSAAASVVTYLAQKSGGALTAIPLATRIENALVSYVTYIVQMFWPARLAVFYPFPQSISGWKVAASFTVVAIVSALAMLAWRTRPYLTVGWFWYLGTLVPVIGLVQVGQQAHADRYTYIPMVGLLLMLVWGAADVVTRWPRMKLAIAAGAVAFGAAWIVVAWNQIAYWQNSETLFQHAIEVTQDNWLAEYDLGIYLNKAGRGADAIPHFETALRLKPDNAQIEDSLGGSLVDLGDCDAAVSHFEAAIREAAGRESAAVRARATYNLGFCQMKTGNYVGAISYLDAAIGIDPRLALAHFSLAVSFSKIAGRTPDAIREYENALRLTPDDANVHASFGQFLASLGRTEEANAHLETAQRLRRK